MKPKIQVVFDTNIYLSAIIFGGNPRTCLNLARGRGIKLFASKPILLELARNLQDKFLWDREEIEEVIGGLVNFVDIILPKIPVTLIKAEPKDNKILECALEAQADYIVSGDKKHLLSLHNFKDISLVSAKQFLEIYYS